MAFSPSEFKPFKLENIERVNHNVSLFRFKLPSPNDVAGLSVASCVVFRAAVTKNGKTEQIIRPYTPTSSETDKGFVDFVIKDYPQGNMSHHVHSLKIGDTLDIKGPFKKYDWETSPVENVAMVAGGTGITPMLQILRKILHDDSNKNTKITLIFGNQQEQDILFKKEFEEYEKKFPDRFKAIHVLSDPSPSWSGHKGFISEDLIKKNFHNLESESSMVFVCGPPAMMEAICGDKNPDKSQGTLRGHLKNLGYHQERVYKM